MQSSRHVISLITISVLFFGFHSLAAAQWSAQQIPPDVGMLLTIDFADSIHGASSGWSFGFHGRGIYTTDGGAHWEQAVVPDSSRSLVTLQMLNTDTGYIAGAYNVPPGSSTQSVRVRKGYAYRPLARGVERFLQRIGCVLGDEYRALFLRTTNGGRTWEERGALPDSLGYLIGASFVDALTGYATGDGLQSFTDVAILKTTDGGEHWARMDMPDSIVALRNIRALDVDHAVAVGYENADSINQGVILTTTNGGISWEKTVFPSVDNFTDVFFSHATVGYAVGVTATQPVVYKTSDTGITWQPVPFSLDAQLLNAVRFVPGTEEGIIAGDQTVVDSLGLALVQPFVGRTTDGGTSWTEEQIPGVPSFTLAVGADLLTHEQAYLSGGDGMLGATFRFGGGSAVTGGVAGQESPTVFFLHQNYPNPFNPLTIIRYTVGGNKGEGVESRNVSLVVYDVLGREMAVLVNERKRPGTYQVSFDGLGRASGVYFYRLMSGDLVQTRTMMLLK